MSWPKNSFANQYTIMEVIKTQKQKITSIVRNTKGQYYIAKKININDAYIFNEIDFMRTLKHPNIVAFHDLIAEKDHIYLIEQYCQQGDLAYHIRRQIRKKLCYFSEKVIAKWLLQLLLALECLHSKKIMHRDIRPQNIFLTANGNLKLGCFRSSKQFHKGTDLTSTVIISSYYMAPQCLQNQGYDQKVDIWALGCLLYEMCSLKQIFKQNNLIQQANLVLTQNWKQLPPIYSKQLQQIFNKCLTKDFKKRQAAKYLLRQPYFIQQMKKLILEKPPTSHIPIKQYNIHFNVLANKKKCNDILVFKQKCKIKVRENQKQKNKQKQKQIGLHLPKIQDGHKDRLGKRLNSKQQQRNKLQTTLKSESKKQQIKQKSRQNSKQSQRKKSTNRIQTQEDQQTKKTQGSYKKFSINQQKTKYQPNEETPKKILCPPPLLPKPHKKIQKKDVQKFSPQTHTQTQSNFSQTMKQQQLSQQFIKISKGEQKQRYSQQQIKANVNKILDDLGIKQEQQIQFSFELEDENMARLTLQQNQGNQLIQTYKSKLSQLIAQINTKYCPNLQTIQQRTQQFDSNTFANIKR